MREVFDIRPVDLLRSVAEPIGELEAGDESPAAPQVRLAIDRARELFIDAARPQVLYEAIAAADYGPYASESIGSLPVNFLSDVDTTGGNSGSATLDDHGRLVGLLFDGNWESMISDWDFLPEVTRSIHVDVRYTLWVMDRIDHAWNLLEEMGVEPAFKGASPNGSR